jgi:hypothetical protein
VPDSHRTRLRPSRKRSFLSQGESAGAHCAMAGRTCPQAGRSVVGQFQFPRTEASPGNLTRRSALGRHKRASLREHGVVIGGSRKRQPSRPLKLPDCRSEQPEFALRSYGVDHYSALRINIVPSGAKRQVSRAEECQIEPLALVMELMSITPIAVNPFSQSLVEYSLLAPVVI